MNRPMTFLLALLLVALPALAEPESRPAGQVKIASYNAEFFFDVFDDPYTPDEEFSVKQLEEIQGIAAAIRALDADVVAFQELENEELLRAINRDYLSDMGYAYIVCQRTNSELGQNLGVMSRLPIRRTASYRFRDLGLEDEEGTWRFARDLMQVTIAVPMGEGAGAEERMLHVYVAHFKSKRDGEGDPQSLKWRTAEAYAARGILQELLAEDPDALAAVVGDLNDTPESRPLEALLADPDGAGAAESVLVDIAALEWARQEAERARTFFSRGGRYAPDTIDYILATPALAKRVVERSAGALDPEAFGTGSDHVPVYATFNLGDH